MRVIVSLVALLGVALAGCADEGAPASPDDDQFEDLGGQATATTGLIRGVVFDGAIAPVADAKVALAQRETTTNSEGAFVIDGLEPGVHFLQVSKPGYRTVQQSTEVVAGVERPEMVKIQILADPSLTPLIEPNHWQGYFTCSTAAFQVCPAIDSLVLCTIGSCDTLKDEFITIVEIQSPPTFISSELVWEANQVLASQLDFYLEWHEKNGTGWDYVRSVEGDSPLLLEIDEKEAASLDYGTENDLRHRTFPAIQPESLLFIEQEFEVFTHEFYNTVPAEGWRFSQGGPPA